MNKCKSMKKYICHANNNHSRAGVATPPDKIDFKTKQKKNVTRDRERYFMIIKISIHQEVLTIIHIYVPYNVPKFMKQRWTELRGKIDNSTIIFADFNIPPLITD